MLKIETWLQGGYEWNLSRWWWYGGKRELATNAFWLFGHGVLDKQRHVMGFLAFPTLAQFESVLSRPRSDEVRPWPVVPRPDFDWRGYDGSRVLWEISIPLCIILWNKKFLSTASREDPGNSSKILDTDSDTDFQNEGARLGSKRTDFWRNQ